MADDRLSLPEAAYQADEVLELGRGDAGQPHGVKKEWDAATEAKKEEARGYFQKGLTLLDDQAWDAALVEFQRSRQIYPTRNATKNADATVGYRDPGMDERVRNSLMMSPPRAGTTLLKPTAAK